LEYLGEDFDFDSDTDGESVASLETDDGQDHKPEKILAQQDLKFNRPNDAFCTWYLVKWEDCPVIRSSWETGDLFSKYPHLLQDWTLEKELQAKGKTKALDIKAFELAVLELEVAERKRRILRRFRKRLTRMISIVDS
jgi:hypothetical protein